MKNRMPFLLIILRQGLAVSYLCGQTSGQVFLEKDPYGAAEGFVLDAEISVHVRVSVNLKQSSGAHSPGDAHRYDSVFYASSFSFDEDMPYQPCARHTKGMPDGDRTAVDI